MERILYDYHLAQGMAEAEGGDVEQNRYLYVQKVFEKHHITEAQFDTSMVWYSGNASHLEEIYKHIEARLERESNAAGLNIPEEDKYARFTAEGDTANIWQGKEMFFLHGNREENLYTLIIPADSTFHRGDYFMLRFGNRFITQDGQRESFVLMQVRYDNDSVVGATSMVASDHDVTLNITKEMVLPEHAIKSLSCTFYYAFNEQDEDKFRLWVISKPVLLRYHSPIEEQTDSTTMLADSLRSDTLPDIVQRNLSKKECSTFKVSPALLFIQHAGGEGYDPTLCFGKQPVRDIAQYSARFNELLEEKITEMFSPDVPFVPTDDLRTCSTCPFALMCRH